MKAVVQRVLQAQVTVAGKVIGEIDKGMVVLLGVAADDEASDAVYLADKIAHLRIFNDSDDKMNLSLLDIEGRVLAISQFTLYADTRRGRRPSFSDAAHPEKAAPLYECFMNELAQWGVPVEKGVFGAEMHVQLLNHGPVTLLMDSKDRLKSRKS